MALLMAAAIPAAQAKKLTLQIVSTYPPEKAKLVYEPLRQWLSDKTGYEITLSLPKNYYFYWREAQSQMPDLTLDDPHVASFRMEKKGYLPLAKKEESITYHLIAQDELPEGKKLNDFMVGKKVVVLPSPSLSSIYFDKWFTNLFQQPTKAASALSWRDAVEQIFDEEADAAIVPDSTYRLYPNFFSLRHSEPLPGRVFLASPELNLATTKKIQKALLEMGGDNQGYSALVELNSQNLVPATKKEYEGLWRLLPGMFGKSR
jgi:hypothetical protein